MAFLVGVRDALRDADLYPNDPFDMSGDDYQWALSVFPTHEQVHEELIDIQFDIAEARSYGDDPEDGINFGITIVKWGGEIIGGLTPYNYTPECWVSANDPDAVEDRFGILENADIQDLVGLILENV
jgi:hypothetical protein